MPQQPTSGLGPVFTMRLVAVRCRHRLHTTVCASADVASWCPSPLAWPHHLPRKPTGYPPLSSSALVQKPEKWRAPLPAVPATGFRPSPIKASEGLARKGRVAGPGVRSGRQPAWWGSTASPPCTSTPVSATRPSVRPRGTAGPAPRTRSAGALTAGTTRRLLDASKPSCRTHPRWRMLAGLLARRV